MTGTAGQQRVPLEFVRNFVFPLPPIADQCLIVKAVENAGREIRSALGRARREVALLLEYRTRLIADVVTGKLDVRRVQLPEIEAAEEPEPLTEAAEETDGESELVVAGEADDAAN